MSLGPYAPTVPPGRHPSVTVHVDMVEGRLTLTGALDKSNAHLLQDALSALLLTDRTLITVDVTGLTVGDRAGIQAIGTAYRRALRHDRQLTLIGASRSLRDHLVRVRLGPHILDQHAVSQPVAGLADIEPPGTMHLPGLPGLHIQRPGETPGEPTALDPGGS